MKYHGISFRPTLLPTLLTLVLVPLLAALGFWQLDRAEQKRQIQRQFAEGASTLAELRGDSAPLPRYQRVRVRGRFDQTRQFLLDNMLDEGRPGSHVLGVFELEGATNVLIVNLGWVEAAADRSVLARVDLPRGQLVLTGRLDMLPRPGLKLESEPLIDDEHWPKRVVYPDIQDLEAALPYRLYPLVLLLDESEEGGFRRDWAPLNFGPEKHIAYAVQWFALAATLLVIFVVVNIRKSEKE